MKNVKRVFLCFILIGSIHLKAQDSIPSQNSVYVDKTTFGFGGGLDFGGFGGNLQIFPSKNLGLFAGVGYAFAGAGYNVGVKYRTVSNEPKNQFSPFAMLMYGYNAVLVVKNTSAYDRLFYGPSLGVGFDFRSIWNTKGYWSIALIFPIRGSAFDDYVDDLEANHNVILTKDLTPVTLSIGYRIIMH